MDQKIQLIHPDGKKAVSIGKEKYDLLSKAVINYLRSHGKSTHAEILHTITEDLKKNKVKFEGSINWYLEWVKLDLEARKEIKRVRDQSTMRFFIP